MFKRRLCQIKIRNQKNLYFLLFDKECNLITLIEDFKHSSWNKHSLLVYELNGYVGFFNIKDFNNLIIDTIKHLLKIEIKISDIDYIFIKEKQEYVFNFFEDKLQVQKKQYTLLSKIRHFFSSFKKRDLPHRLVDKMIYEQIANTKYSQNDSLIETIVKIEKIIY